jgi:hypothetical protein
MLATVETFTRFQLPVNIDDVEKYDQNNCFINVLQLRGVEEALLTEIRYTLVAHKLSAKMINEIACKYRFHSVIYAGQNASIKRKCRIGKGAKHGWQLPESLRRK